MVERQFSKLHTRVRFPPPAPVPFAREGALLIDLGALVDCAGTAYWRRKKAVEFPNDRRNLEAAEELERLAAELSLLEGSKLHVRLDKCFEDEDGVMISMSVINEILRQVGFSRWYGTGDELLQAVVDACAD